MTTSIVDYPSDIWAFCLCATQYVAQKVEKHGTKLSSISSPDIDRLQKFFQ